MYFTAKKDVILHDIHSSRWYLIKKDNIYKGEYTPVVYDPQTLQPIVNLIIVCEDGKYRRFDIGDFYTLEEWREIQLNNILD